MDRDPALCGSYQQKAPTLEKGQFMDSDLSLRVHMSKKDPASIRHRKRDSLWTEMGFIPPKGLLNGINVRKKDSLWTKI
tara:strand:+ start:449 stop:685 length:237 start_codon:yes stop_codon:yes gene_type:complete